MVSLTKSNILYGWHNNIKHKQALNVTLLIAKFHIFATSSCDGNLCFEGFLLRLQDKLDILKQSYIAQRKLHKFFNIWENYYKFHFASSFSALFFPLSLIVTLFFKPAVVLFVSVNFIYILKQKDNCYHSVNSVM